MSERKESAPKTQNIWEKHAQIVCALKAPKDKSNQFGGFMYRKAEDIYQAVKPLLSKFNVTLIAPVSVDFVGGQLFETCTAVLIDCENPSDRIEVRHSAREALQRKGMDDAQVSGSASTYATKYALMHLFCIDDTKDEVYAPDPDTLKPQVYQPTRTAVNHTPYDPFTNTEPLTADELKAQIAKSMTREELVALFKGNRPLSERADVSPLFAKRQEELSRLAFTNKY